MKKYLYTIGLFLAFHTITAHAQSESPVRQVTHQYQLWYGYVNNLELQKNYFLVTEIENRSFANPAKQYQFLTRTHLHKKIGSGWDAGVGFAYFLTGSADPFSTNTLVVPELRPHIELNYKQAAGKVSVVHRYKAEERFFRNASGSELAPGYTSNFRFRYRLGIDLSAGKYFKIKASDEVLVNAGRKIVKNVFDSNRIYVALAYQPFSALSIELGYLNLYQQRTSGDKFYDRDIVRFTINHKLSTIKKQ